jgi:hypothetical protein
MVNDSAKREYKLLVDAYLASLHRKQRNLHFDTLNKLFADHEVIGGRLGALIVRR